MYARVTTFEGGTAEALRAASEQMRNSAGPPPGVPAKGITMLFDPETGRSLAIVLFATEEDRRTGDEALRAMTPSPDGGHATGVEMFEVGADVRL